MKVTLLFVTIVNVSQDPLWPFVSMETVREQRNDKPANTDLRLCNDDDDDDSARGQMGMGWP
jgi:hypothetical protein